MKDILYALSHYLYQIGLELIPYNNSIWEEGKVKYRKGSDPNTVTLIISSTDYNKVCEHLKSHYSITEYDSFIPECAAHKKCVVVAKK